MKLYKIKNANVIKHGSNNSASIQLTTGDIHALRINMTIHTNFYKMSVYIVIQNL